jgi:hypothetical protein
METSSVDILSSSFTSDIKHSVVLSRTEKCTEDFSSMGYLPKLLGGQSEYARNLLRTYLFILY